VDVLAARGRRRIGVEVETGKSDVVLNVRNGPRSGFDQVLVVVADELATEKVEKLLAMAGLLIPRRVEVVLRDRLRDIGQGDWDDAKQVA
jgi:hypothetical protein